MTNNDTFFLDAASETTASGLQHALLLQNNDTAFPPPFLEFRSLVTSATMFAVGVLGNVIAVAVLCISKKEQKETIFYTLVCGMAVTDLLGTCFTSPVVIATYVAGRWPGGVLLCDFFSFSMLFFGSAGMSILCAMAVERYLAINRAYFYSQHVDRSMARFALVGIYLANVGLCVLPSFGFGQHVRHFPGTWCFLDWRATDPVGASYSFLYGGVMLVLIAVTVLCNCAVCRSLVGMNQRARTVRAEASSGHSGSRRRFPRLPSVTSAAEMRMFWLLILMTIVFLVCSIPFVVRIFVNQLYGPALISAGGKPDYRSDLLAIRFASFNPILDPWVYILCRKNLLVKGCERLKRNAGRVREDRGHSAGWAGVQHSPQLFEHSDETSYASLRTALRTARTHHEPAEDQASQDDDRGNSFTDFAMRQAWDYDTARVDFHPFSVEHSTVSAVLGAATRHLSDSAATPVGFIGAQTAARSADSVNKGSLNKADIVTCTFSTPSSTLSAKCI